MMIPSNDEVMEFMLSWKKQGISTSINGIQRIIKGLSLIFDEALFCSVNSINMCNLYA